MQTLLLLFFLGSILFVMSACQRRSPRQITEADMEKFIKKTISLGTPRSEVMAYLETLKFDSRSLVGVESYSGRFESVPVQKNQPPKVHSHVTASLPDAWTERDGFLSTSFWLSMVFYFDENDKLIGHSVYSLPDS
jgi:hypothetical protein